MHRRLLGAAGLALAAGLLVPAARADSDHDRARAALVAGEVLPLAEVLQRVARQHPGHVLEVELEREDGRWVYELKLLQGDGGVLKLEADARDGTVLRRRSESGGRR
ncbi:PepSY domain-containing protein [Macromonas nakdongensis]|uniref:PepSY domain-containing protein n=1 Tax=Macromonas nakdongensis TaxID=1843082 RepID=UPI000C339806|nr:PepSY domain-containing protein [Macromonas nakdongensis]